MLFYFIVIIDSILATLKGGVVAIDVARTELIYIKSINDLNCS